MEPNRAARLIWFITKTFGQALFELFQVEFPAILTSKSVNYVWIHLFSTHAKFCEKLACLNPWYSHVRVRTRG